jgi:hypothetical protein
MTRGAAPAVSARALRIAAAAAFALVAVPVLVWLLAGDERLAGSNAVAPKGVVAGVATGERLCVRDLRVPEETAAVRVFATAERPATLHAELRPVGGTAATAATSIAPGGVAPVDLAVGEAEASPATLCLGVEGGRVALAGVPGLETDRRPQAFLDGRPLPDRVAVQFVLGGERTLLSRLDDAARHATVFKAGFAGPWTFWLLALGMPVLWALGLRRLWGAAREPDGRAWRLGGARLVALLALGNALCWALVTPVHEGPDEYAHVAYANHLAEAGRTPVKGSSAPFTSSEHVAALDATNAFAIHQVSSGRPPWDPAAERAFDRRDDRLARDDGGGGDLTSVVHAPGYYAVAAAADRLAGGSFWDRVLAMRLASALLAALVAACAYGIVRELMPGREWAAVAAGLLVAFQPMMSFVGGVVNADMGANAAGAAILYLLVRALRRGRLEPWVAAALPLAFVWGVLAKATVLAFAPVIGLALAYLVWRRAGELRAWGAMAASLVACAGVWALAAAALDRELLALPETSASHGYSIPQAVSYVWQQFLPHLPGMTDVYNGRYHVPAFSLYGIQTWAAFGWLSIRFEDWVYFAIGALVAVAGALALVALWRHRVAVRERGPALAVLALGFGAVALLAHLAFVRTTVAPLISEQGRYFFPAIVTPAVVAVGACFALGARRAPVLATWLVAALMAFCGACQLYAFASWYA